MPLTVKEIQAMAEKAHVYELRPDARYLIILDPTRVSPMMAMTLGDMLVALEIVACLVFTEGPMFQIIELEHGTRH